MSAVAVGVVVGAVAAVAFGGTGLFTLRRKSETADRRRADRFAREQDLWLPPEHAPLVGARVRRRAGIGQLVIALVGSPVLGWSASVLVHQLHAPLTPDRIQPAPGPLIFVLIVMPVGLITAVVDLWDTARVARAAGTSAAAPAPGRLADVVPPWLTWFARCFAVGMPTAAAVVCAMHGRTTQMLSFSALVVLGGLTAWGVERGQLRVLNGRRMGVSGPELAFDDAFRVVTLMSLVMTAPLLVGIAGYVCCVTLDGAGSWALPLFEAWMMLFFVAAFAASSAVNMPSVRRYYRKRLPLSRASESTPC